MQRILKAIPLLLFAAVLIPLYVSVSAQQSKIDFARDIQPILATHCAGCHGSKKQEADLRLDDQTSAMRVIKAGNSNQSRLVQRILGLGGEARMPLNRPALRAEQITLLKQWIDEGATWSATATPRNGDAANNPNSAIQTPQSKHWAFVAPVRPALPSVKNKAWVRNPIDAFVLAKLERENLTPSAEADKITLLRRLSLDLVGLPPTPEEIDTFLKDTSPKAYEKQVERLLASPHYGEKWARQWLDAARYADSDGFEKDKPRAVWFYRDWVINALNQDKPYDQFIIEQIAGDLLPNATQEQIVATGFLRNSMINEEGGVHPEQFRMEAMFDRMDAIGKGILGITIQCAQCHTHKFDPIKHEEYYAMFAFLNNSYEGATAVYTPDEQRQRNEIFSQIKEIEAKLQEIKPDWLTQMNAWEDRVKNDQPQWTIFQPEIDDISTGGARYMPQNDGSILVGGYAPTKHRVQLLLKNPPANITAFRLELLTDPDLPLHGPGRSYKGSCALTEFEVETAPASNPEKITKLKFANATADVNPPEREVEAKFNDKSGKYRIEGAIQFAIDGKEETAWSIDNGAGLRNQSRKAVFNLEKPLQTASDTILSFYLRQHHGGTNNNDNEQQGIGRFRLSYATAAKATADPVPARVREIFATPRAQRTKAQIETIFSYWRTTVKEFVDDNQRITKLWQQYPEGTSQLVMNERSAMRDTHLLKRGDFLRPDKKITPGVPSFLHPLPADAPLHRLTFAKWLVAPESPTTGRSLVNRLWQSYFGTGLVATSEDLGKQSEAPSHPELLDWLAVTFRDGTMNDERGIMNKSNSESIHRSALSAQRWSVKAIHRLIVTSATYRQSSKITPQLLEKDPLNRWLARAPRLRVEGEIVRDIALATSGLLNPKVGGASVFPPAPEFIFLPPASFGTKNWQVETGANRYRRALYTFRFRSVPYPMLQTFDTPNGDVACVRRAKSNTPLQALTTLNETLFIEAARALALQTIKAGGVSDAQKIAFAFRRVLARLPTAQETTELLGLLNKQHERFVRGELNPWNVATDDPNKSYVLPSGVTMSQVAAWTTVARVLLNLDEAITKE